VGGLANILDPEVVVVSGGAAGLGAFKTALQIMGIIESNTMSNPMPALNEEETTAIKVILERNSLV
jgi:4-hydroxy-tetrahydrodipicolinate synthase